MRAELHRDARRRRCCRFSPLLDAGGQAELLAGLSHRVYHSPMGTSSVTQAGSALEIKGAEAEIVRERLRRSQDRLEGEVRSGVREASSLHVIALALGPNASVVFPKKPYPTSGREWR